MKPGDVIGGRWEIVSDGPVAIQIYGRGPACRSAQCGGGHYHCPRCGAVTSMFGHAGGERCEHARAAGLHDDAFVEAYRDGAV